MRTATMVYEKNTAFNLLYNELWLVDEEKLNKINHGKKTHDISIPDKVTELILNNQDVCEVVAQNLSQDSRPQLDSLPEPDSPLAPIKNVQSLQPSVGWDSLLSTVGGCSKCNLAKSRQNIVIERGSRTAKWMFVGEAPGANEDREGLPFVGVSGELLNRMIDAMGLDANKEVYVCNVIKCRPPQNRNPDKAEIELCYSYLATQIDLVKPIIIVALGRFAIQTLLNTTEAVNKLRGKVYKYGNALVIPTFHPSYLLRNPVAKKDAWDDLQLAMQAFKDYENNN